MAVRGTTRTFPQELCQTTAGLLKFLYKAAPHVYSSEVCQHHSHAYLLTAAPSTQDLLTVHAHRQVQSANSTHLSDIHIVCVRQRCLGIQLLACASRDGSALVSGGRHSINESLPLLLEQDLQQEAQPARLLISVRQLSTNGQWDLPPCPLSPRCYPLACICTNMLATWTTSPLLVIIPVFSNMHANDSAWCGTPFSQALGFLFRWCKILADECMCTQALCCCHMVFCYNTRRSLLW